MKDCVTLGSAPQSYSKKKGSDFKRPAWYSGEVVAGPYVASVVYAGVPYKGDVYTLS